MLINFLTAAVTLAKKYTPTTIQPYPQVYQFTSYTHSITTITDFYSHLQQYSANGACLLKGTLQKPLKNESRAGSTTNTTPTQFVVFDIDRCNPSITTPEQFIESCLPPVFRNTSYIWQWSNSAKITKHCLAGHLFFLLDQEINPGLLKKFITQLNFESPELESEIRLAHNGLTLTWGLDPTCAQNDKIIYIAPPILENISDPIATHRITLVKKALDSVALNLADHPTTQLATLCTQKLQALRTTQNLPKKTAKYKTCGDEEILKNPDTAVFRGPYIDARGFRYGNLNNGNSYAYFHGLKNPKVLYNFKGEPPVFLKDIDPDYWHQLISDARKTATHEYFVFRDPATDVYYTTTWDTITDRHTTYMVSNNQKALDFLKLHNQPIPESIPLWNANFNPTEDYVVDKPNQRINWFQKTSFLTSTHPIQDIPKKFRELVRHVVGYDLFMMEDLINWLAYIVQYRDKAQTAVVLHGRTGTGKGVLFTKVMQPILGKEHCPMIMLKDLDREYNEWLERGILVIIDEAQLSEEPHKAKQRINKIKNLITEQYTILNKKYLNATQVRNYANFIFVSNEHDSIWLHDQDRRFKICPRQEQPLNYTEADITLLQQELPSIAGYLLHYPVNVTKVREIPDNTARATLIQASQTSIDEFISIIKHGDLASLLQYHDEFINSKNAIYADRYRQLTESWTFKLNTPINISTSDLRVVYSFIFNTEISATKFSKILASKGIINDVSWVGNKLTRTIQITWKLDLPLPTKEQLCQAGVTVN